MPHALLFAYGSLMDANLICPYAESLGSARLDGYQLAFTRYSRAEKGGVADIVPNKSSSVWGVLYEMEERCFVALDDYEGVPRAYRRETLVVNDCSGAPCEAFVYLANRTGEFAPSRSYRERIVRSARENGLPEEYIRRLEGVRTHG